MSQEPKSSNPGKTSVSPKDFNHIELDADEIEEALREGRAKKHYRQYREEYSKALLDPPPPKKFTSKELFDLLPEFIKIDEMNEEIVTQLCRYFAEDPEFESTQGLQLNKGLLLFGGVGVGKTTLMRAFTKNQRNSYVIKMTRAIEDDFSQDGDKVLKAYSGLYYPKDIQSNPYKHEAFGICFDDLGTEPISKYYGKDSNVMAEVILNRYDKNLPFSITHITTNLSTAEMKSRYGTRVTDRMREMFNLLSFPTEAPSRRK